MKSFFNRQGHSKRRACTEFPSHSLGLSTPSKDGNRKFGDSTYMWCCHICGVWDLGVGPTTAGLNRDCVFEQLLLLSSHTMDSRRMRLQRHLVSYIGKENTIPCVSCYSETSLTWTRRAVRINEWAPKTYENRIHDSESISWERCSDLMLLR